MKNVEAVFNGTFDTLEKIKISPLSRAYTFSDSVYEVIPFHNAKGIAYEKHISRLQNSCNSLSISANIEIISKEITELINKSKFKDGYVYYQVSRGVDQIRSHMFDNNISVETFGYVLEHSFKSQCLKVMLCEDVRWSRCDIKSTSLLGNIMSMNSARNKGCDEVIMYKNDAITEGGASNVFFASDECVYTPSLSSNILPGITRELLIQEIKASGINVEEGDYKIDDLMNAKSIWLTSSTKGLAQVTEIINQKTNIVIDHHLFLECEKIFKNNFLS